MIKHFLCLLFLLPAPAIVSAMPMKYKTCESLGGVNSPSSDGLEYYYSESCDSVYVMPPANGAITIGGYSSEVTVRDCKMFQSRLDRISQKVTTTQKAYDQVFKQYQRATTGNSRVARLQNKCDKIQNRLSRYEEKLNKSKSKLKASEKKLSYAVEELGADTIAIFYQNDGYGQEGLTGLETISTGEHTQQRVAIVLANAVIGEFALGPD